MAAAFRLTTVPGPGPTSAHVVSSGRTGAALARHVARGLEDGLGLATTVVDADTGAGAPGRWPGRGVIVLCAGGPRPALEERLHDVAAHGGAHGLPVVLEHPLLRVGPVAAPGAPCSPCLYRRRRQLARDGAVEDRWRVFEDPDRDPAGVLPHEVELASALAVQDVGRLVTGEIPVGRVRWFDLLELRIAADDVVGVHGCACCGGRTGDPARRTWASLVQHARHALDTSTEGARS